MNKLGYILIGMLFFFTACKDAATVEETPVVEEEICNYSYNEGTTEFSWTAFKTSDRVGVSGGFNEIEVESERSPDPIKVLESITFRINTSSVETNNIDRNRKVAEHFFNTINTDFIEGKIKSLNNGMATIELTMNGLTVDIEGDYVLDENEFRFSKLIDVTDWNAMAGIEALNTVCGDLHAGPDGVSKLWSEVELKLFTRLMSDCD